MRKGFILFGSVLLLSGFAFGQQSAEESVVINKSQIVVETILTEEEQKALTPDAVLESLKRGNERFMRNELTARDHSQLVRESAEKQFPKAIVLSCVDSRVPVEDVFDKGIGDIFVARVAGNFINDDILGSMEFATKVAGAKLILVLGHENCGAIHAAVDGAELGNITGMLKNLEPAIKRSTKSEGKRSSKNRLLIHEVCENNVRIAKENIMKGSPVIKTMVDNGEIAVAGAVYDMDTGVVIFLK